MKQYTLCKNNLTVTITTCKDAITKIDLSLQKTPHSRTTVEDLQNAFVEDMNSYLRGEKIGFDMYQVDLSNLTHFQRKVLLDARRIPYGEVVTYGELAWRLNTSPRAVGGALSKNPVPIVIPCHRVVGAKGLGGFSCGVPIKKLLLEIEGL
jgi:methylated-DNA-[protein]-cysteine S-methyltransferase